MTLLRNLSANDEGLGVAIRPHVNIAIFDICPQPDCKGKRQDFKDCQVLLSLVSASKAREAFTDNAVTPHYVLLRMCVSHVCASQPVIVQKLNIKRVSAYILV